MIFTLRVPGVYIYMRLRACRTFVASLFCLMASGSECSDSEGLPDARRPQLAARRWDRPATNRNAMSTDEEDDPPPPQAANADWQWQSLKSSRRGSYSREAYQQKQCHADQAYEFWCAINQTALQGVCSIDCQFDCAIGSGFAV